jgi:hypothetical protein
VLNNQIFSTRVMAVGVANGESGLRVEEPNRDVGEELSSGNRFPDFLRNISQRLREFFG